MKHVLVTRANYLSVYNVCNIVDQARSELDLPYRWKLFGSAVYKEYQLILRNMGFYYGGYTDST